AVPGLASRLHLIHPSLPATFQPPVGALSPSGECSDFFHRRTPMGWYFSRQTRDQLIHELIQQQESESARSEVIAHTLRGNVLWSVVRITAKQAGFMKLAAG